MPRPTSRADSANHQFQAYVPSDLQDRLRGQKAVLTLPAEIVGGPEMIVTATFGRVVKFSLRTTDRVVAANRNSAAVSQLASYYQGLRSGPRSLSHRETIAYSGEVYRLFVDRFQDNPGSKELWEAVKAFNRAVLEGRLITSLPLTPDTVQEHLEAAHAAFGAELTAGINAMPQDRVAAEGLEKRFGWAVDWVLAKHALIIDSESRAKLLLASSQASTYAALELKKNASGDYSPDPAARRFPPIESVKPAPSPASPTAKATLTSILKDWWKEAQATGRKPSTYESYSSTIDKLVAFLGHDDATQVTPEDVVNFKEHRLASVNPRTGKTISPKTVKDSDLSGLKTLFGWAVSNRRLSTNPADRITIKLGKRKVTRPKGFTDDEADALLRAADALTRGAERERTYHAKKWAAWLCAYTGARIGEIAQLRKEDIRKEGKHWVIHITPEAGTVKTDEARDVVMHEHLVVKGFPEFVQGCKDGHLFLKPAKDGGDVLGPLQGVKNRITEAARLIVPDKRVQPNHGWRHRFKTVARSVGMDGRVVDAIQGHAPRTAGDDYGEVTIEAMALAMSKFPNQLKPEDKEKTEGAA